MNSYGECNIKAGRESGFNVYLTTELLFDFVDGQPHAIFVVDRHGGCGVSGTGSAVSGS